MDPQSLAYLNQCYDLLPPFIRAVERKGSTTYLNDVTGEMNSIHPLDRFKSLMRMSYADEKLAEDGGEQDGANASKELFLNETSGDTNNNNDISEHIHNLNDREIVMTPTTTKSESGQLMEYHCQWKERNAFGQMSMYGLTLRYDQENGTTSVRFDGVSNSDWTFTALKGPYGLLEPHDLYVGAKVEVFGRHLTISTANSAAVKWIERESRRLTALQAKFRKRIESVGQKPVVIAPRPQVVRHVERENKKAGQINLRKLLSDISKLGDQLAQLGLAEFALS